MKKKLLMLALGIGLIGVSIVCLHAVMALNEPWEGPRGTKASYVNDMIIDGASELLQSAADAFLFFNEVEIAGKSELNFNAALQRIDMAAERVQRTRSVFKDILNAGGATRHDAKHLAKLRGFSYDQFARENGLSEETMREVSAYLGQGNMLGFYARHIRNLQTLSDMLQGIRADLLAQKIPENKALWSLLHQYNATLMFGNYASMVFYKI